MSQAFGWTAFLIPNHLMDSGVNGIATLIFYATGLSTGVSVFNKKAGATGTSFHCKTYNVKNNRQRFSACLRVR